MLIISFLQPSRHSRPYFTDSHKSISQHSEKWWATNQATFLVHQKESLCKKCPSSHISLREREIRCSYGSVNINIASFCLQLNYVLHRKKRFRNTMNNSATLGWVIFIYLFIFTTTELNDNGKLNMIDKFIYSYLIQSGFPCFIAEKNRFCLPFLGTRRSFSINNSLWSITVPWKFYATQPLHWHDKKPAWM